MKKLITGETSVKKVITKPFRAYTNEELHIICSHYNSCAGCPINKMTNCETHKHCPIRYINNKLTVKKNDLKTFFTPIYDEQIKLTTFLLNIDFLEKNDENGFDDTYDPWDSWW